MRIYLLILLGIGIASFIWFLSTITGSRWMERYAFRLRTNNNTRAGICWMITGMLFICHLLVCAVERQWPVGLDVSTSHHSQRTEKFLKLYEQKMAETKTIKGSAIGLAQDASKVTSKVLHRTHAMICSFLGYTVLSLSIFSAIYTVIAFRDEFLSAWEDAKDKVFGHRSGEQDLLDVKMPPQISPAQTQQPNPTNPLVNAAHQPLRLSDYIKYEFIVAIISELINVFMHRRRI